MTPSPIVRDAHGENPTGGEPGSARRENLNTGTLRSLSRHKNLMYSAREAEMLEDIFKTLAIHQPSVFKELFASTGKTDHDDLAESIVALSYGNNSFFPLMKYMIQDEFETNQQQMGQILRENSNVSKLVKAYLNRVGRDYLIELLGKHIQQVVFERKVSYEVDPAKLDKENDNVEENRDNLEKKVEAMLKLIMSKEALDKMPPGIRILAQYVAECTKTIFKDEKLVSTFIGSFIVLRFMNPAIFTPEQVPGLLPKGRAPTPQTRRNLTLISKIIQNLANHKEFKEQFMKPLNAFVEKHQKSIDKYFSDIVNFPVNTQTVHSVEVNELSVYDLHMFHSLLFQNKDVILAKLKDTEQLADIIKLMDRLGSYEKKVSFAFLDETHQKFVKQILATRGEEASFIGYIDEKKKKDKKLKISKQVLVVGMHRIYTMSLKGKLGKEAHQLDLVEIKSPEPGQFTLVFKTFEIDANSEQTDEVIESVRRAFEYNFFGMPQELKFKVNLLPASRLQEVSGNAMQNESCGGLLSTYNSLCDYYAVMPNEQVKWDLENLYQNNRTFNLKKFTAEYEVPLTDKDTMPLFHALAYNVHFSTVVIKHFKFEKGPWSAVATMMRYSKSIQELTLIDVNASSFIPVFEAMAANENLPLTSLNVSRCPIDEKAMQSLTNFVRKSKQPFVKVNVAETTGDKIGKAGGLQPLLEALETKKSSLLELNVSGNKLTGLESSVAKLLTETKELQILELADTQLTLNRIPFDFCINLRRLNLSANKFVKADMWTTLTKFLASNTNFLEYLNINRTGVPLEVLKSILTNVNPDTNLAVYASENNFGLPGAQLIGSIGPQITNIYHLDLSENGFSDEGITAIAEGFFHNQSVSYLNLDRNWSREPRTKPRANAVNSLIQLIGSNHIPLEALHIAGGSNSRLKDAIVPFIYALGTNTKLTELDVSGHAMGNKGVTCLAKILETNHALTTLYWDDNTTGLIGFLCVKDSIVINQTIKNMPLPFNDIVKLMNELQDKDKITLTTLLSKIEGHLLKNQLA
jgi:hypothetical protein